MKVRGAIPGESRQRVSRLAGTARARTTRWPLGGNIVERRARESVMAIVLAIICTLGSIVGTNGAERLVLAVAAALLFVHAFAKLTARTKAAREAGFVVMDDRGIVRRQASATTALVDWSATFGVSLFANKSGDRGVIAFTSEGATRCLGVHVPAEELPSAALLFARSAARADDDALFAQGVETSLGANSAAELLRAIETREPDAIDRLFLSSVRGEAITIERSTMRVAGHDFDLRAPLDWRPFLFHEVAGHVTTIYQATWVRQLAADASGNAKEVVLVAPLPATSEVRLSPSLAEAPPLRETRVAIERLFMPLIRRALERAPRATRTSAAPQRAVAPAKGGASSGA
ncbi:MAG: hypothetical protein ABI461_04885 [Polyangiaceae bacterium]